MTEKRRVIPVRALAAEKAAITQFLFDVGVPTPGVKIPLQYVFKAYKKWRAANSLPDTELVIDGFGRMFPHVYERRNGYWEPEKQTMKCVFGLALSS